MEARTKRSESFDPKVRTVGFAVNGEEDAVSPTPTSMPPSSPSPVIIPPKIQNPGGDQHLPVDGSGEPARSVTGSSPAVAISAPKSPPVESQLSTSSSSQCAPSESLISDSSCPNSQVNTPTASAAAPAATRPAPAAAAEAQASSGAPKGTGPPHGPIEPKPKLSKAERRALQEQQRAAKEAKKSGGAAPAPASSVPSEREAQPASSSRAPSWSVTEDTTAPTATTRQPPPQAQQVAAAVAPSAPPSSNAHKAAQLFAHLPRYNKDSVLSKVLSKVNLASSAAATAASLPREVVELGLKYSDGTISGSSARCVALLQTLQNVIREYSTPASKSLSRDLTPYLNPMIDFLIGCRPLNVGMGNAIRFLKLQIASIPANVPEVEAKAILVSQIEQFLQEKIVYAHEVIINHAISKIADGDVVLTHATSSVVQAILLRAHDLGRKFRVVVVDSGPKFEGRVLLKTLLQGGLSCSYTHINSLPYIMSEVTKVFLGAAAVLSNGTVVSRVGTAAVAMVAHSKKCPVMICCETCKFTERVQLDSFTSNELGDPEAVVKDLAQEGDGLAGWADIPGLSVLNLTYDAMPCKYITMIITEFGMVPPTSVPVILREYRKEPAL
ncbi:hypothetical protein CYMTET_11503 [Cymbomonas tetramitiformis]|uniref:Translation initiation factor eIF2B subunit delta n=1 Tax=Cymbomonas tetramitiformis TaxID=36881 RepID=A0AAE0GM77_9CHLO|nr:hypothetical protein CYMTET_11503 [Cymbomonas tetramitiformis]